MLSSTPVTEVHLNMRSNRRWLRWGLAAVVGLSAFAAPAYGAKDDEKLPPYDVQGLDNQRIWVPWIFAFLFAAGCVMIAFKNPHRSHLN